MAMSAPAITFIVGMLLISMAFYWKLPERHSIVEGSCNYFLRDANGSETNIYLYRSNLNFSLHGFWPTSSIINLTDTCLSYAEFHQKFYGTYLQQFMISLYKFDPDSGYCCHFQYHEYIKHGCKKGISYKSWYENNLMCVIDVNLNLLFPTYVFPCIKTLTNNLLYASDKYAHCANCVPSYSNSLNDIC